MGDQHRSKDQLLEELAELKKSEEQWRSLAANAPLFIAIVDRDGVIQFLNRVQPGHTVQDAVGKRIYDYIEPEYHELARECLKKVFLTGEAVSYETVGAGPDGNKAWYATNLGPIRCGEEIVSVSLFSTEITVRKKTEASLQNAYDTLEKRVRERTAEIVSVNEQLQREIESRRQSEERYRLLVEKTNDLIWELDQNGVYTYVSPAAEQLLGYSAEEMIGKTPFEFMQPNEADRIRAMFEEYVASREGILRLELARIHKDGRHLVHETNVSPVFNSAGQCCGFRGISRDITQRRCAEEALREHHEELRAIYDGMVDGLLIADIETKRFLRANDAICRMLGYTEEELLARSVADIHPPEALPDVLEHFNAQAEGRLVVAEDLPVLCKAGTVFYADISTNQLMYRGRPCNIGFFRDITDRKLAEEALRNEHRALSRLLKAQDRERQIITYEIHDGLAQKLTAAVMQFEMFDRARYEVSEEASQTGTIVHGLLDECLAEARHLINGMRPPILDEHGVVYAIEHLACNQGEHSDTSIAFRDAVNFDRLEPVLENAIYRIVQESLSNACRHSKSERVQIDLVQRDQRVQISVQDWGVGFDPKYVDEKCFGLAGIRERARLLGGTVRIDTQPGKGSRIAVELPVEVGDLDM